MFLGGTGSQQIVDVHDPDRPSSIDNEQRGDLHAVLPCERFADKLIMLRAEFAFLDCRVA